MVFGLAACGGNKDDKEESGSKTKTEASKEAGKEGKGSESSSDGKKKGGKDYALEEKGFAGPYKFLFPAKCQKTKAAHGMFCLTDTYRVGVSNVKYGKDAYADLDTSTIDALIESSKSEVLEDMEIVRGDIFPNNTYDEKPYFTVSTKEKANIDGKDAYFVHGVVGNEKDGKETYIVLCYVMDEKAPYYLYGVADRDNPGPEDGVEDLLKAIDATMEWNE